MKRIAILGGGISGLAAAYELELARKRGRPIDWHLYESSPRLGGIVDTAQHGSFILEGGPDAWVTEKPWARELAIELGLEDQIIASNDDTRKTYIFLHGVLQPIPDGMRMMVPSDLAALDASPLFSDAAKQAYADEIARADELRQTAPGQDESVASFTLRHFGQEILTTLAAPILSGIFGGDVEKLSVRSVMPAFVKMEREHGSLILALQHKNAERGDKPAQPIFTTLRHGLGSLTAALIAQLPPERLHVNAAAKEITNSPNGWLLRSTIENIPGCPSRYAFFDQLIVATPLDATRKLLRPLDYAAAALLPKEASSAVLAALAWPPITADRFAIPPGFGFLIPQTLQSPEIPQAPLAATATEADSYPQAAPAPTLLAATFVDQKFSHRAPANARILRAFFSGPSAESLAQQADDSIAAIALEQLAHILGPLPQPAPALTTVRRWLRSLPQYEVGHLDRMDQLDTRVAAIKNLALIGNSYRGVGVPDLIHAARSAARDLTKPTLV